MFQFWLFTSPDFFLTSFFPINLFSLTSHPQYTVKTCQRFNFAFMPNSLTTTKMFNFDNGKGFTFIANSSILLTVDHGFNFKFIPYF